MITDENSFLIPIPTRRGISEVEYGCNVLQIAREMLANSLRIGYCCIAIDEAHRFLQGAVPPIPDGYRTRLERYFEELCSAERDAPGVKWFGSDRPETRTARLEVLKIAHDGWSGTCSRAERTLTGGAAS